MKIQALTMISLAGLLDLLAASASGQLLNTSGQVWNGGSAQGAKYIEIQVTQEGQNTFSGVASFKLNGEWIAEEQSFSGTQQKFQGGIIQFDATCHGGTRFSGWLFSGNQPATNSDDRICVYFTPEEENHAVPCNSEIEDSQGMLSPGTP